MAQNQQRHEGTIFFYDPCYLPELIIVEARFSCRRPTMLALSTSSFAYSPVAVPTVAPRMASPSMAMTDGRFPAAGKGVLPDGRTAAIPFLVTPAHLDGTMAGDNVRRPPRIIFSRRIHTPPLSAGAADLRPPLT